jgi:hypothetical protein
MIFSDALPGMTTITNALEKGAAAMAAKNAAMTPVPPLPPPAPLPVTTTSDFFTENKTALLVGGGAILVGVIGYMVYKKTR